VLVPAWIKVIRPRFLTKRGPKMAEHDPPQVAVG